MSLDVYLNVPGQGIDIPYIPVRENGRIVHLSKEAWDERYPDKPLPIWIEGDDSDGEVYSGNITHNLAKMAEKVQVDQEITLYQCLWRPEEVGIKTAQQLIIYLECGLMVLRYLPELFIPLNPSNGWGSYDGLVEFVEEYLAACKRWPEATVSVWR